MPVYPFPKTLQFATNDTKGNFSLWYHKRIPLKDFESCKACDGSGDDKSASKFYETNYTTMTAAGKELLARRNQRLAEFCQSMAGTYDVHAFQATLVSPMVLGIGQEHASEVGMIFDRNLGIPYIPASSLKGVVRFAYSVTRSQEILKNPDLCKAKVSHDKDGDFIEDYDLDLDEIFGGDDGPRKSPRTKTWRGAVIFLDAYPENIPALQQDIMNPHYGPYYSSDEHPAPPADYHDPNPVKFLSLKPGTKFNFRVLVPKLDPQDSTKEEPYPHRDAVKKAIEDALAIYGLGAKTAVGYGRFKVPTTEELLAQKKREEETRAAQMTPEQRADKLASEYENQIRSAQTVRDRDAIKKEYQEDPKLKEFIAKFQPRLLEAEWRALKAEILKTAEFDQLLFDRWQRIKEHDHDLEVAKHLETITPRTSKKGIRDEYQRIADILGLNTEEIITESAAIDEDPELRKLLKWTEKLKVGLSNDDRKRLEKNLPKMAPLSEKYPEQWKELLQLIQAVGLQGT